MKCSVENCDSMQVALGFCTKHYKRVKKYGHPEIGRFIKTHHPLYMMWNARQQRNSFSLEWKNFEQFINDVGDKPPNTYLTALDDTKPCGPKNFIWKSIFLPLENENNYDRRKRQRREIAKANPNLRRISNYKYHFSLTLDQYNGLLEKQNGVCAICKQRETAEYKSSGKIKQLAVDHCHKTNKVRGLLCTKCNTTLGRMEENIDNLQSMIEYLKHHDNS